MMPHRLHLFGAPMSVPVVAEPPYPVPDSSWRMEDESDQFGLSNLTNYGSIGFGAGYKNNAAIFAASGTQQFYCASNAAVKFDGPMTIAMLLYWTGYPGYECVICAKPHIGFADYEYQCSFIRPASITYLKLIMCNSATTAFTLQNTFVVPSNKWLLIFFGFDGTNIFSSITNLDGSTVQTPQTQAFSGSVPDLANTFMLGGFGAPGYGLKFSSKMDSTAAWGSVALTEVQMQAVLDQIKGGGEIA